MMYLFGTFAQLPCIVHTVFPGLLTEVAYQVCFFPLSFAYVLSFFLVVLSRSQRCFGVICHFDGAGPLVAARDHP